MKSICKDSIKKCARFKPTSLNRVSIQQFKQNPITDFQHLFSPYRGSIRYFEELTACQNMFECDHQIDAIGMTKKYFQGLCEKHIALRKQCSKRIFKVTESNPKQIWAFLIQESKQRLYVS